MILAAERDFIAAQYANGFQELLGIGMPLLRESTEITRAQPEQITCLALNLLARFGDTLITRKCGPAVSDQVRRQATEVLASGWPHSSSGQQLFSELDAFLRADGNRRNPGTTADSVAAILFGAQREGWYCMQEAEFSGEQS